MYASLQVYSMVCVFLTVVVCWHLVTLSDMAGMSWSILSKSLNCCFWHIVRRAEGLLVGADHSGMVWGGGWHCLPGWKRDWEPGTL